MQNRALALVRQNAPPQIKSAPTGSFQVQNWHVLLAIAVVAAIGIGYWMYSANAKKNVRPSY